MGQVLRPLCEQDWSVRAGDLEWSCWTTAAHVAHDLTAYAGQLVGPGHAQIPAVRSGRSGRYEPG